MTKIAVIGAGQIGSRHLQGLLKMSSAVEIWMVDISAESLKIAETLSQQVVYNNKTLYFVKDISNITASALDLAIIATSSAVRLVLLEKLVQHCAVKYIVLEKFLFPSVEQYVAAQKILDDHSIKAWVNCPRRFYTYYRELKNKLGNNISFSAVGNSWGMASNGIHFLDLFAFLSGDDDIQLQEYISSAEPAKRAGYFEFFGTVKGINANFNSFEITSFNASPPFTTINIYSEKAYYQIVEDAAVKVRYASAETGWKWQEETFEVQYQSNLSNLIAEQILATGASYLPSYQQSTKQHLSYLEAVRTYLQKNTTDTVKECLIT